MDRVVVAMSGGVDSAVAASILLEQGYEVVGITMQIWPEGSPAPASARGCCSLDAVEDARRASQKLGIPHYVLNMREDFERTVIADFVDEYRRGRTPNPCVQCNRHIKFDALMERAQELGAAAVATGHYARKRFHEDSGRWGLFRAADREKDQTYVLHPLTQAQLSKAIFPLGDWLKSRTRERAAELGLRLAGKPDSQEICFVPNKDYGRFLESTAPDTVRPGKIVDTSGKVRGDHRGVAFFTIGQRKGLGIAAPSPLYVTEIDPVENRLIVGSDREVMRHSCIVGPVNWIGRGEPAGSVPVLATVRYNMNEEPATVSPLDRGRWLLRFHVPQRAITPGQSAVFYGGEETLGGGSVESVIE